jgi:carboxymethylenebutenolidase
LGASPVVAKPATVFRAALLFYPGCRVQTESEYRPNAPALMFVAAEDEEVSPAACSKLVAQVKARGIEHLEMIWYPGATHAFDDPGKRRQSNAANRAARTDSMERAARFFAQHLQR